MSKLSQKYLSAKRAEFDQLENAAIHFTKSDAPNIEIVQRMERPEVSFLSTNFRSISEWVDIAVIDEPLKTYLMKREGMITDIKRKYTHYEATTPSNSFSISEMFNLSEFQSIDEVLCNAYYLIERFAEIADGKTELHPVLAALFAKNQENIDLGVIQVSQPAIKDHVQLVKFFNVHLEFLKKKNGELYKVHVHCIEFPRDLKAGRQGLIADTDE